MTSDELNYCKAALKQYVLYKVLHKYDFTLATA